MDRPPRGTAACAILWEPMCLWQLQEETDRAWADLDRPDDVES